MFGKTWLKDAAERAVKTFAQTLLALIGAGAINIVLIDWGDMLGLAGTATLLSVLTSVVSAGVANNGTASVTNAVEPSPVGRHEKVGE